MVWLTSSQSPVADITSTMYCRTRSKALDWFQVTCNDVSMIVVIVTSEGATGTKTKIHQLSYVNQTQTLFLWPITKCADNPRNQSEPEALHIAGATGGKTRFAPIGGRYFWLADKVARCFSANYKASFYTFNQTNHHIFKIACVLLFQTLSTTIMISTMPHDQFKSAFIPYK